MVGVCMNSSMTQEVKPDLRSQPRDHFAETEERGRGGWLPLCPAVLCTENVPDCKRLSAKSRIPDFRLIGSRGWLAGHRDSCAVWHELSLWYSQSQSPAREQQSGQMCRGLSDEPWWKEVPRGSG